MSRQPPPTSPPSEPATATPSDPVTASSASASHVSNPAPAHASTHSSNQVPTPTSEELASAGLAVEPPFNPVWAYRTMGLFLLLTQLMNVPDAFSSTGDGDQRFWTLFYVALGGLLTTRVGSWRRVVLGFCIWWLVASVPIALLWQDALMSASLVIGGLAGCVLLWGAPGRRRFRVGLALVVLGFGIDSYQVFQVHTDARTYERVANTTLLDHPEFEWEIPRHPWLRITSTDDPLEQHALVFLRETELTLDAFVTCEREEPWTAAEAVDWVGTLREDGRDVRLDGRSSYTDTRGRTVEVVATVERDPNDGAPLRGIVRTHHLPELTCSVEVWAADLPVFVDARAQALHEGFKLTGMSPP